MCMELGDREIILFCYIFCLFEILVPDAEAGCGSSYVRPFGPTRTHTRIDSDRGMRAREELPIGLKLMETGSIEFYTKIYYCF